MYKKISEPHYYMLVASLPSFKREMADHKELPITQLHLKDRLRFLKPQDSATIDQIVDLITTDNFDSDDAYLEKYNAVHKNVKGTCLESLVDFFMDWRMLLSATRIKLADADKKPDWDYTGQNDLMNTIRENWDKPYFDLQMTYPMLPFFMDNMKSDNTIAVENSLLSTFWEYLAQLSFDALFGLDAVAAYVLRYYILKRWLRRDFDQALATVNETIDNILEKTELSL